MTASLQPGPHLSPDQLSAFAENVLPEHERLAALSHLAGCAVCRQTVFLTQQADPALIAPQPTAETPRRGWFTFSQFFGAATAALACSLILALIIHHRYQEASPLAAPVATAKVEPPPALAPSSSPQPAPAAAPAKVSSASTGIPPATHRAIVPAPALLPPPKPAQVQIPPAAPQRLGAVGAGMPSGYYDESKQKDTGTYDAKLAPSGSTYAANAPSANTYALLPPKAPAAVAGAIPKPPAPIPTSGSHLHGAYAGSAKSDTGKSISETVPVAAAAPAMNTVDATVEVAADKLTTGSVQERALAGHAAAKQAAKSVSPIQLPSNNAVANVIQTAGRSLALDTAGNLFLSNDNGKHWSAVTPRWSGKAVAISLATASARLYLQQQAQNQTQNQSNNSINGNVANNNAAQQQAPIPAAGFELTTSTSAVWSSTDGVTWRPR